MKKIYSLFTVLITVLFISSCSSDDNSDSGVTNAKIVLTQGSASYMEITPVDNQLEYYAEDVKEFNNTSNVSIDLPSYTHHFYLDIQGSQQQMQGYVEINGIQWEFYITDWYHEGVYYLEDFN